MPWKKSKSDSADTVKTKLARAELLAVLTLFVLSVLAWALAEYAQTGAPGDFDRTVLLSMRNPGDIGDPLGPDWIEETARDFTALGSVPVLLWISAAATGYLALIGKKRIATVVLLCALGAIALSSGLKDFIDRARPDLVPHATIVYTASFPSGHSMHSASVYLTLAALLARVHPRWRVKIFVFCFAIFTTFGVGISRIYLGVHWPTDIFAGWTAGAGWALLCWLLARQLQRQGQVEDERGSGAATG